ncbi:MAG TPA: glycoside hydrolase [Chthonomonadales bacterium]|nr:glycoside hydrolase [Chthonomonadales bacterium]
MRALTTAAALLACGAAAAEPVTVTVDPARVLVPRWEGFGSSLSWWAVYIGGWPEPARREAVRLLFSRDPDALGWNIARYNAGGTSPETDPARFRPGGRVLVTLDRDGTWLPERDRSQIETLRLARRFGADRFELFVNSPPYWMLRNGDTRGGPGGGENLVPERAEEYADWLAEIIPRVEREAGVRFTSVAPFNEPSADWWNPATSSQEGSRIDPPLQARVLSALRRSLDRARLRTLIAASDEHNPHTALRTLEWLTSKEGGNLDARTLQRLNVHTYWGWEWQDRLREAAAARGVPAIWMSEVTHREWAPPGYVPRDMRSALPITRGIVNDVKRLRPTAWVYWQPIEPLEWQLRFTYTYGLMQAAVDRPVEWEGRAWQPGELVKAKGFYAMMQFSRFIRPGDRILETDDFWSLAALDRRGRRLTVVVHNDTSDAKAYAFDVSRLGRRARAVKRWRTQDDTGGVRWDCREMPPLTTRDGRFEDTVPPRSVTTYVLD